MTGQVNDLDAFCLGFGQWMGEDDVLLLAVLEAEAEMREAEFEALAVVLAHAEDGELRWPDVDDLPDFGACVRAAGTLGWLGTDGAAVEDITDPPIERGPGQDDDLPPLLGAWLDPETTSIEAHNLAGTVVHAETEFREAEWEAVGLVLDHVEGAALRWPAEASDRAELFEALSLLGWHVSGPEVGT